MAKGVDNSVAGKQVGTQWKRSIANDHRSPLWTEATTNSAHPSAPHAHSKIFPGLSHETNPVCAGTIRNREMNSEIPESKPILTEKRGEAQQTETAAMSVSNPALVSRGRPQLTVMLPWVTAFQEPNSHRTSFGSPTHEMTMLEQRGMSGHLTCGSGGNALGSLLQCQLISTLHPQLTSHLRWPAL